MSVDETETSVDRGDLIGSVQRDARQYSEAVEMCRRDEIGIENRRLTWEG